MKIKWQEFGIKHILAIIMIITLIFIISSITFTSPQPENISSIFTKYISESNASSFPQTILNSLMVLLGIFFTIIVVTFSLSNKIPFSIMKELIIFTKETFLVLVNLILSSIFVSCLSIQNLQIHEYYILILILMSTIVSIIFYFFWYAGRIDLKNILEIINIKFQKEYFKKSKNQKTRKYLSELFEDEQEKKKLNCKTFSQGYKPILHSIIEKKEHLESQDLNYIKACLDDINRNAYSKEQAYEFIVNILYKLNNRRENEFSEEIEYKKLELIEYVISSLFHYSYYYFKNLKKVKNIQQPVILFLGEQIRYKFHELFEKTKKLEILIKQKAIINQTIDFSGRLIKIIVKKFYLFENEIDDRFLKSSIQDLNSILEWYQTTPERYNENYYSANEEEKDISNKKAEIIKEAKIQVERNKLQIAFWLIFNINKEYLPKRLLNSIVFPLLDLCENIYFSVEFDMETIFEELHPSGAFATKRADNNYFRLIYIAKKYQETKTISQKYLPEATFNNIRLIKSMNESLLKLQISDFELIDFNKSQFNSFNKILIQELTKLELKAQKHENQYIINQNISEKKKTEFKNELIKEWNEKAFLRRLFEINKKSKIISQDNKEISKIGILQRRQKNYFIDNQPIPWAGDWGHDIGRNLARGENLKLIEYLSKEIIEIRPRTKEYNKIIESLIKKVGLSEKLALIITGTSHFEIENSITNYEFKWNFNNEKPIHELFHFRGRFMQNNIEIPVFHFSDKKNRIILIDFGKIGILNHYQFDDMKEKEKLNIKVDLLTQEEREEIKKKFKETTNEELDLEIAIKIFEKFELEIQNKQAGAKYSY